LEIGPIINQELIGKKAIGDFHFLIGAEWSKFKDLQDKL